MQHTHDASMSRAPRARAAVVPVATSSGVALLFAILLLALLVLLL